MIQFWTDGSGVWDESGAQPTGYAFVALIGEYVIECAARSPRGTNNTAELSAAIMALNSISPKYSGPVVVRADSMYVINQAKGVWKVNANRELVLQLQELQRVRQATWEHVRGHTGDWGNERADVLAGHARKCPDAPAPYFTHVRIYLKEDPEHVLLDKFDKPSTRVWTGEEWLDLRLLI
jgi:ribonuclease HI